MTSGTNDTGEITREPGTETAVLAAAASGASRTSSGGSPGS